MAPCSEALPSVTRESWEHAAPIYLRSSFWTSRSQKLPSSARHLALNAASETLLCTYAPLHFLAFTFHPEIKCNLSSHHRRQGHQVACLYSELISQPHRGINKENFQGKLDMGTFMLWFTGSHQLVL